MSGNQINFNWGGMGISDTLEIIPKTVKHKYDVDEMAYVDVSLYKDEADSRKAVILGRERFVEICGDEIIPKIHRIAIVEKKEIKLFTSEQIEYTIEIIADKDSVAEYYDNLIH
jgi:hypothetical protein